jgi:heptosyltransferase II
MTVSVPEPKRILAVKTHALGDLLLLTPAIRALKKHYCSARLDFLTGSWSRDAVRDNPYIDRVLSISDGVFHDPQPVALFSLIRQLRQQRYDLGFVFQPSPAMHCFMRLAGVKKIAAPVSTGPRWLVHYPSPWRMVRNRYVVEDFLDVVGMLGIPPDGLNMDFVIPDKAMNSIKAILADHDIETGRYLVICPGGGRNPRDFVIQKIWPAHYYQQLVDRLIKNRIRVVLAGTEKDREMMRMLRDIREIVDLTGKTSFAELGELLRNARLLLTNDSAPMHLALSVGCPFVALFGPSRRHALLPETGRFFALDADIPCAPCYDNEPFGKCDRSDCIRSIEVDRVYESVMNGWKLWGNR